MIIIFSLNLIVLASAFLITDRVLKVVDFIDFLISVLILYFSQIILTELSLGVAARLYLRELILLNLFIFALIWVFSFRRKSNLVLPDSQKLLSLIFQNKVTILAFCAILVFGGVKVLINLANPPFGWDALNYHFTFAVEWLKHGNLDTPIVISDVPYPSYFPINGSLYFLWLIFPLKNVFLADLGQVPFFVLSFLCVFNISRKLKVSQEMSLYAAALFVLIPNFFKQLQIAYVDVVVTGLFLACINYLLRLDDEFNWQNVLIYALSLGLLLGVKTVALPYSILLFIPFFCLLLKNKRKLFLFGITIIAVFSLGGFSYLRNFFETGNPLYPMNYCLFGKVIFKGVLDNRIYGAHFNLQDFSLIKLLFHEGLGAQTLIFILPAMFLVLPLVLSKKERGVSFVKAYLFLLPFLIYLAYRFIIPLPNSRYLYPLLGLGMALGFFLTRVLSLSGIMVRVLVIVSILASFSELAKREELVISLILTFLLFFSLLFFVKPLKTIKRMKKSVVVFFFAFIFFGMFFLEKYYLLYEYSRYSKMVKYSGFWPDATKAWEWLNKNTTGNNIAYIGRPVPFPLYGSSFKNNVYYVSVNKTEPAKLHYFPNSHYLWQRDFRTLHRNLEEKGNYRQDADYATWLNNLKSKKIDYLFVYSLHQIEGIEFSVEDRWAKDNSKQFNPVFQNDTVHIYKITSF